MRSEGIQIWTRSAYIPWSKRFPRVIFVVDELCRCIIQRSRRRLRIADLERRDDASSERSASDPYAGNDKTVLVENTRATMARKRTITWESEIDI